ncbi:hypothetical protein BYT27DRAFT_7336176 [Phlegmacium glaucopus]|nr:hypothetical protein BYT27DRAFT_7336176 [Phlegmacium glaucopus]
MDARGEILDLKDTVNGMVARLRALAAEVTRVTLQLGIQGKIGGRAHVPDVEGAYALEFGSERMCSVLHQGLDENLSSYKGDLTQKIEISVEGLFQLSCFEGSVNSMVDQLSAFALEVTRVALKVGTQGRQRMSLHSIFSFSFDDNLLQKMTSNLADQVLSISEVTKALALEMFGLKTTVNSMGAQLGTLANEVTQVRLGLKVSWVDRRFYLTFRECGRLVITNNVNLMAMNLTNQLRSIAEVIKACRWW